MNTLNNPAWVLGCALFGSEVFMLGATVRDQSVRLNRTAGVRGRRPILLYSARSFWVSQAPVYSFTVLTPMLDMGDRLCL